MSISKKISLDASIHMRLLHQEHKFQICVIRKIYQKRKVVQKAVLNLSVNQNN